MSAPVEHGTISLGDEERVKDVVVNAVLGLWSVVNDLTRLRPSGHERYRVTIFGSARARAGTFVYEETRRVARALEMLPTWRAMFVATPEWMAPVVGASSSASDATMSWNAWSTTGDACCSRSAGQPYSGTARP